MIVSVASLGGVSCSSGILDRLRPLEGGLVFGTKRLFVSAGGGSQGYRPGTERDMSADNALLHGRPYSEVTPIRFGQQNKIALKIASVRAVISLSSPSFLGSMWAGLKSWTKNMSTNAERRA